MSQCALSSHVTQLFPLSAVTAQSHYILLHIVDCFFLINFLNFKHNIQQNKIRDRVCLGKTVKNEFVMLEISLLNNFLYAYKNKAYKSVILSTYFTFYSSGSPNKLSWRLTAVCDCMRSFGCVRFRNLTRSGQRERWSEDLRGETGGHESSLISPLEVRHT